MANQIQGRHVTVKAFINGKAVRGLPAKKFDFSAKQENRERQLLGEARVSNQLIVDGYKGTVEIDVESGRHHEIIDFLNKSDKSLAPSYELAIQVKENYQDGSSKRYRFVRCTFMIPDGSAGGRKEDVGSKFEWHAEDIVYLN